MPDRTRDFLHAIDRLTRERGYPPSWRELAEACGYATISQVTYHLRKMPGLVAWEPERARTVHLTEAGRALL